MLEQNVNERELRMDRSETRVIGQASRGDIQGIDPEIEAIADQYVALTQGNLRLALAVSVADGIEATRLVSRGFARWGQPVPVRQRVRR